MLESLTIKNFGCLQDVTLELAPLTVLVGPNDAGKSMLMKALQALSTSCRSDGGWRSVIRSPADFKALTFNQGGGAIELGLLGKVLGKQFKYEVALQENAPVKVIRETLEADGRTVQPDRNDMLVVRGLASTRCSLGPDGQFLSQAALETYAHNSHEEPVFRFLRTVAAPIAAAVRRIRRHLLRPERLLDRSSLPDDFRRPMAPDGLELGAACADLLLANTGDFERIEQALCNAMPHVAGIHVQRAMRDGVIEGQRREEYLLYIRTKAGARIPGHLVSDGVLLFLGYLVLLNWPEPPSLLMIEEPETGLHPGLMSRLVNMLEDASAGQLGAPPVQIIVTTQSPDLLNYVRPECIRVIRRGEDGATRAVPFTNAPDLRRLLEYQSPGEIWVNLGEDYIARRGAA
jgi:energy-coupling factor transporter ATP-binding protein EcfA2